MIQIVPQSVVLTYIVFIATQLKWAWDYLLYQSFFVQPAGIKLPEYVDDLSVTCYENNEESRDSVECAVCLCKIEEGDEIRELRCDHLFHRVCLDRWLGYGHMTCPLCRNILKFAPLVEDLYHHQELILINFCATTSRDRCAWWLR
ncbi:E3 ubiquitin-protein ligase RHA2B-like [Olea europaea var. sylvestris]|uniref:E3 ubiquitin-protein ligase RHA2B-like n=1 Tax=Olea europaea var. sylvestris TaxID=158386 RepID=UPI000C1D677A|nr:E3 ubiquitin-protein ligase RHA2B-like [Olea europaea var. sylvestris]